MADDNGVEEGETYASHDHGATLRQASRSLATICNVRTSPERGCVSRVPIFELVPASFRQNWHELAGLKIAKAPILWGFS